MTLETANFDSNYKEILKCAIYMILCDVDCSEGIVANACQGTV